MEQALVIQKKGDAANYANYQQGVTFWSIRVSVRWKLTHTVFNELITTRTLGHFFIWWVFKQLIFYFKATYFLF